MEKHYCQQWILCKLPLDRTAYFSDLTRFCIYFLLQKCIMQQKHQIFWKKTKKFGFCTYSVPMAKKKGPRFLGSLVFASSGDWTRTSDLRVMSPTSYLLLYPAMWTANIQRFLHHFQTKLNIPFLLAPIPPKIHKFGLFTLWTQSTILYPLFCPIPSGPCSSCLLGADCF